MTSSPRNRRRLVFVLGIGVLSGWLQVVLAAEPLPPRLELALGELQSVTVEEVSRVAIGDPAIADVSVVSANEVLVQAHTPGTTSLVVWDQRGRSSVEIRVIDRSTDETMEQLQRVLEQLNYPDTDVKQEGRKVYVVGQVPSDTDRARVDQVLTMFPGAVNLTTARPVPTPPTPVPALVRLNVQMVELTRLDLEKLGVKWSEALALTEPAGSDLTLKDTLYKWGTSLNRTSVTATLNALIRTNRGRLLAEPKLVTTSGKPAESFLGTQIPILSATNTGSTGAISQEVEFKDVGVLLKITPTVQEDGETILTALESEVSTTDDATAITVSNTTVPGIKTRKARTEIITKSGETIVVAGLVQSEDSKVVDKVPGVGSVPVLGRLFRSPQFQNKETELVVAVTPELMRDVEQTADKELALEQALSSAEVAGAVEDPRLRYALQIQDRIAKALRYPQRERELGLEGRVTVRVHVFADGTLGRAIIAQSSGIESLDAEALKAAETQAPYPPIPSSLTLKDVWLDIPVIFRR